MNNLSKTHHIKNRAKNRKVVYKSSLDVARQTHHHNIYSSKTVTF